MENLPALITLIAYSAGLIGISLWVTRRAKTEESYFLGERNLGPWVAGLAYAASSSSAWVLLGFSGFVYTVGPSALWMVPGILVGYAVVWLWAGPVLQKASREKGHVTLSDFLAEGAAGPIARMIRVAASIMIVFCFSYYIASQFQGAGVAFDGIFGTGLTFGVLLGAGIILAYTLLGGFLAVSLIDTIQGLLIGAVAIILPAVGFMHAGGIHGISEALDAMPSTYTGPFGVAVGWAALGFVVGSTATGFGSLGQPHLISWIMAARDTKARVRGAGVAIVWAALVYTGMAILGLAARSIFGANAPAEGVFFEIASTALPSVMSGVVVAATLSAIMSTVDSQLLVAGAAISHDLGLGKVFRGRDVLISRLAVAFVCLAAVFVTLQLPATIFERTLFGWTALGASFGPTVVARAAGFHPSGRAVLASLLSGFLSSIAYEFILPSGPGAVWARIVPWALAFVALALFSLRRQGEPHS
jgi:sodium/proline symporter